MVAQKKPHKFTLAEAEVIGNKLGINWQAFDIKQFRVGLNAELADGAYNPMTYFASNDPILIGKIVRAHLNEDPDYYSQWAQMEKAAKRVTVASRRRPKGPRPKG